MAKRPRTSETSRDRVILDVGGTRFATSVSTLTANSTYFESLFSRWDEADEEVFLDRDPDVFRVLLSCMRQKKALLPESDKDLFKRAVLDAEFLGIEWLLNEIKVRVFQHDDLGTQRDTYERYKSFRPSDDIAELQRLDAAGAVKLFDFEYKSIDGAYQQGALPGLFFKRTGETDGNPARVELALLRSFASCAPPQRGPED